MLMCARHWHQVPTPVQREVWRTFRTARGSKTHFTAIKKAIEAVGQGQLKMS